MEIEIEKPVEREVRENLDKLETYLIENVESEYAGRGIRSGALIYDSEHGMSEERIHYRDNERVSSVGEYKITLSERETTTYLLQDPMRSRECCYRHLGVSRKGYPLFQARKTVAAEDYDGTLLTKDVLKSAPEHQGWKVLTPKTIQTLYDLMQDESMK